MSTRPAVDVLEPRTLFATLTAGVTYATSVSSSKPLKNWSIDLKAGQAIYVTAGESSNTSFTPQLILIGPNRKTVARSVGDQGALIGKVAPATGTYTVRVRDNTGTNTGSVSVTAVFTGSTPIADGDDAGTVASGRRYAASIGPGDLDVWRIDATAGQYIQGVINENTANSPVGVGVALLGPDGSGVLSVEDEKGTGFVIPKVKTGIYYAVAYETAVNASGRYGFSVGIAPGTQSPEDPDTQEPLSSGSGGTRTGDLPSGDIDVFRISLAKNAKLTLNATRTGSTTTPALSVVDPNGNLVGMPFNDTGDGANGPEVSDYRATAAAAGTYYVILVNSEPSTGGAYRLRYSVA